MIGQEEFDRFEERIVGQQSMKRMTKAIMRMALMWGLEPTFNIGAEATSTEEVCLQVQASESGNENFWLWLAWFGLFILWIGLATVGYFAWRRVSTDLYHC